MEISAPANASKMLLVLAALVVSLVLGCGDDIGAECRQHSDCDDRCVTGREFPDGMCTRTCDSDNDCPSGTSCVDERDGICLLRCEADRDCPGGYECDEERRRGDSGEVEVCIGA